MSHISVQRVTHSSVPSLDWTGFGSIFAPMVRDGSKKWLQKSCTSGQFLRAQSNQASSSRFLNTFSSSAISAMKCFGCEFPMIDRWPYISKFKLSMFSTKLNHGNNTISKLNAFYTDCETVYLHRCQFLLWKLGVVVLCFLPFFFLSWTKRMEKE